MKHRMKVKGLVIDSVSETPLVVLGEDVGDDVGPDLREGVGPGLREDVGPDLREDVRTDVGEGFAGVAERTREGRLVAGAPRTMVIEVGVFEANAIALHLEGIVTPRPMTHDLLGHLVSELGATLRDVCVTEIHDSTYFAVAHLDTPVGERAIDCRPSDAIALALRARAPIFVAEEVLDGAGLVLEPELGGREAVRSWFEALPAVHLGPYEM